MHVDLRLGEHQRYALPAPAARHARQVLRLKPGEPLTLFDGTGGEFEAQVLASDRDRVLVETGSFRPIERESRLRLHLGQALARGERMDFAVQKAVELGASAISPVVTERCVVKLTAERGERRVAHWRAVAAGACEQCGRNRVPPIERPCRLGDWLPRTEAELKLVLDPDAPRRLGDLTFEGDSVCLLIGPEGGLSPPEIHAARHFEFISVALGPRTLRTETAAVTALAAIQLRWGDLG